MYINEGGYAGCLIGIRSARRNDDGHMIVASYASLIARDRGMLKFAAILKTDKQVAPSSFLPR
jgi:hypothetical protein